MLELFGTFGIPVANVWILRQEAPESSTRMSGISVTLSVYKQSNRTRSLESTQVNVEILKIISQDCMLSELKKIKNKEMSKSIKCCQFDWQLPVQHFHNLLLFPGSVACSRVSRKASRITRRLFRRCGGKTSGFLLQWLRPIWSCTVSVYTNSG